jgi:trimethylamine--corrinoid protein Co-methyltransferase
MSTESMTLDAQATLEKTITGTAHAAAGVNFIWGAGNLESTLAMSPEALIADDEIAGYFLRFREGIFVDDETLALDAIKEVGTSARDFLTSEHTLRHYRHVLSRPRLAWRNRRSEWVSRGARTFEESAAERLREILAAESRVYLDASQEAELKRIERSGMEAHAAAL